MAVSLQAEKLRRRWAGAMAEPAPRIIGYVRVSTDEQAREGDSLDAQRARLEQACQFKQWQLVELVGDEGLSGTTVNKRPALKRALRAIARGDADGLIVAKLDRLSRSRNDVDAIFEWFQRANAILCVLDVDGLDTSTAMGKAMLGMLAIMAQLFRDTIAENTATVLRHKRSKGERVGRPGVHEIPTLQRRIHRMRHHGENGSGPMTYQEIADRLNLDNIPTLRGAAKWRVSSVQTAAGYRRPAAKKAKTSLPALPKRRGR